MCVNRIELRQQPLRFLLRQPSPNHRLRHLPLASKLVAFGNGHVGPSTATPASVPCVGAVFRGTLHVSLPSDIIQLFGTSSVPAIVAGSVLGLFELGERFASQRAKDALSKWLLTFDVQKAKALPDGTQELFERIFGERHFSWKCFVRSAVFSLGATAFLTTLCLLINPKTFLFNVPPITEIFPGLALWFLWSIIIDYISLFKTRVILRVVQHKVPNLGGAVTILVIDYILYNVIFALGYTIIDLIHQSYKGTIDIIHLSYQGKVLSIDEWLSMFDNYFPDFPIYGYRASLYVILFWSGFAPSIWMWLYVAALFVTRGLLRSEKLVNWLRWALDVEKNPFRSIGAIAATLAFIVSVAIILVSAEVSGISAAS